MQQVIDGPEISQFQPLLFAHGIPYSEINLKHRRSLLDSCS